MKSVLLALMLSCIAVTCIAQGDTHDEKQPSGERLGLRVGYVQTTSGLDNVFGGGVNLALHFVQRIKEPFSVDVSLGAFYLGSTSRNDITVGVFGTSYDNVSMRIINFTAAPMVDFKLSDRTNLYASAGVGLYTVSLLVDENIFQFDLTDNHLGVNFGGGVVRRISENWFLELNAQAHKFWTSTDDTDLFYRYSEGDKNPLFYDINVGVLLHLF
jgi:opacity protein-like surface antigen